MTHSRAVLTMLAVTLMWSIAGVTTRHLQTATGFELTFWRSLFNALALALMLGWLRGPAALIATIGRGGRMLWMSAACWCVMYTAFMVALSLTTVANVLVTMALAPLMTALLARASIGHRLPMRTWLAIAVAGTGIAWMYGAELSGGDSRHLAGTLVALAVPIAAAINWTAIQHTARMRPEDAPDMLLPVLIGAVLSAVLVWPLSLPFAASPRDLALLGMLGVVQLAIPCLLSVRVARVLSAPEVSLLGLLEVVFGVAWVWLGTDEAPSAAVLGGGGLVLAALAANEAFALRRRAAA